MRKGQFADGLTFLILIVLIGIVSFIDNIFRPLPKKDVQDSVKIEKDVKNDTIYHK